MPVWEILESCIVFMKRKLFSLPANTMILINI